MPPNILQSQKVVWPEVQRVVWSEGMYLAPQHFQAQRRYFDFSIAFLSDCFWQYNYGFLGLEMDAGELRAGNVVLRHLRGVMPDNSVVEISDAQKLPARSIRHSFPNNGQPLMLYLALPRYRENERNVGYPETDGADGLRYRIAKLDFKDANTGQDSETVDVLTHNLRIAQENELTPEDIYMPLARVTRDSRGEFHEDLRYIPPCLQVAANPRLEGLITSLLQTLIMKSRELAGRRPHPGEADMRPPQQARDEFCLLFSVNRSIPLLAQWQAGRTQHPARVYEELARLAGSLSTPHEGFEPAQLPPYDHDDPAACFRTVDRRIRHHLDRVLPSNCITIPLHPVDQVFFVGTIDDPRCFEDSEWWLSVQSDTAPPGLIGTQDDWIKVASEEQIRACVTDIGVPLDYFTVPPQSVPALPGALHFRIRIQNNLFEEVRRQRAIGVYAGGEVRNPQIHLHVLLGEAAQ